jgi:hypothetical protein
MAMLAMMGGSPDTDHVAHPVPPGEQAGHGEHTASSQQETGREHHGTGHENHG